MKCKAINKNNKRCKKYTCKTSNYCHLHKPLVEEGICYLCLNECNYQSQTCGICARILTASCFN